MLGYGINESNRLAFTNGLFLVTVSVYGDWAGGI